MRGTGMTGATHLLIRGARAWVPGCDPHRPVRRDVLLRDDRILAIGPGEGGPPLDPPPGTQVLDASDKLLIPGLVNAHYHSHDVLAKGRYEDLPLDIWGLYSQPRWFGRRSRAELRARTLLGAMECLRHGITTVQDMCSLVPRDEATLDTILAAYAEVGIRVVFAVAVRDVPGLDTGNFLPPDTPAEAAAIAGGAPGDAREELAFIEAQIRRFSPLPPRLHWALGPSGPQRCTRALLEGIATLSERYDLPVLTHVYESRAQRATARLRYGADGGSLVRHLASVGLLTPRTTLAHAVYIDEAEIGMLARSGAGVVHNPMSNLKLKNGIAPVGAFRRAGLRVALGCDNTSCSDCQNLFQAMKAYALFCTASEPSPAGSPALDAVTAATIGGAMAVGLDGEIGAIVPGMKADLALISLNDFSWMPFNSAARQMVYAETGRGVDTVIVDGRIVLRSGALTTVDETAFRAELAEVMAIANADHAALVPRQALALGPLWAASRDLAALDLGVERLLGRAPGGAAFIPLAPTPEETDADHTS
jgi:5-methylthioadenosine/S-adenosylhomocysteine deaminase